MAISWGDVLSVGAGAAERDSEYRDAEFKQALESFKEDKAHVRSLANMRYSRDLKKYDEEFAKAESLKSVYANAGNQNPDTAAKMIAMAENPTLFKTLATLNDGSLESYINSYKDGFTYNYKKGDDGEFALDDKGEKILESFTFNRKDFTLNEPKQDDYYLGNEYWTKKRKDIDKTISSPLGDEILKLLGKEKKEIDATSYINDMESKKVTEIKTLIEDGQSYTSTNVSGHSTTNTGWSDAAWKRWQKKNPEWIKQYNKLDGEIVWKSAAQNDNFLSWMKNMNILGTNSEANFELEFNDTRIKGINPSAQAMLATYKSVYESVVKSVDAKTLAMAGVDVTQLRDYVSLAEVNKTVQNIIEQRYVKIETGYTGGKMGENPADFIGIIPVNLIGLNDTYTTNDGRTIKINDENWKNVKTVYKNWLLEKADDIKDNYKGETKTNSALVAIQHSVESGGKYSEEFNNYLSTIIEKQLGENKSSSTESSSTESSSTSTTNKIKSVTENGVSGISDGTKFKSWEQLEKENLVEKTLEKYPYLKSDYDKYKEGSSITKTTESGVEYIPWG